MVTSSLPPTSSFSATVGQLASKNPLVGDAIARGTVDAAILSDQASGVSAGANLPGSPDRQSMLAGTFDSQTDPTLRIVDAVNAHLGQNFNIRI